jgi:hypothetical protein
MPHKMLSCICGNTELERIGVNLLRRDDNEDDSLGLVALICKGNGCGRVTFRPDDMTTPQAKNGHGQDREWLKQLISLFEHVYTERLVYKAIAERDPACPTLLQALRSDKEIRSGINNTFAAIHECINRPDDLMKLLNSLPSMGAPVAIATSAASAPVTK